MRAVDIRQGKLLVSKKYSKMTSGIIKERVAHFVDKILEAYTGKPGIFNTRLVFVGRKNKGDSKQIYVSLFDGSGAYPITSDPSPHLSPSWSRDGRYITYTSYEDKNPDLFIFDTQTKKKRKLSGRKGLNSGANWSNNNQLIAYTGSVDGDADIYLVTPSGDQQRVLIRGSGLDVDPMFSPNGKWLAFVSGRFGNPHIFRGELQWDGDSKVRVLSDKRLTFAGWYNATPTWSPDSEKIVFSGYDKEINRFDLFMMNPDGTQLERLTLRSGDNERPSFAPNGQLIVFHSSRGPNREDIKGPGQLYLMNRDGSNQIKLETGLFEAQTPQWSPSLPVDESKF
jgi:TolB protein